MNMNHTTDKHLLYLANELDGAEAESVRGHLQQCPSCRSDLEQQNRLQSSYSAIPNESASDFTLARIATAAYRLQTLRNTSNQSRNRKPAAQRRIRLALIACALTAVVVAAVLFQPFVDHAPANDEKTPQAALLPPKAGNTEAVSAPYTPERRMVKTARTRSLRQAKASIPVTKLYSAIYSESSVDSDLRYMRSRLAHLAILVSDKDF
jgi:hypothetical protein